MSESGHLVPKHPSTLAPLGASDRNIPVILPILEPFLSQSTRVLELASGRGVHISHMATAFPSVSFQPTEVDDYGLAEINATLRGAPRQGIKAPLRLDVLEEEGWAQVSKDGPYDLVVAVNFLHMLPYPEGSLAIFKHVSSAAVVNQSRGRFVVYGPFRSNEGFFSQSDERFDEMIRTRPDGERLGLRSIEGLEEVARQHGWELKQKLPVAAGNFVLVWGCV